MRATAGGRLKQLEATLAALPGGVVVVDAEGRLSLANRAAERLLGCEIERFVESEPAIDTALRRRAPIDVERAVGHKASAPTSLALHIRPLSDEEGRFLGVVCALEEQDCEQRSAEKERVLESARVHLEMFESILRIAPVGIGILRGPDHVFELVNPALQAISPSVDALGKPFSEVEPDMPQLIPLFDKLLETGEPLVVLDAPLSVRRTPSGPSEPAYFSFCCVRASCPELPDGILGVVVDTTGEVRARQQLAQLAVLMERRAAEVQGILDNMVEGVVVCDADRRVTAMNDATRQIFEWRGLPEPERLTPAVLESLDLRGGDGRPIPVGELPIVRALRGETIARQTILLENLRPEGTCYLQTSAAPLRDAGGRIVGAVLVSTDVSALTELDRLKDQFIRVAAHELKTPVTVMKGYAQALLESAGELSPARRQVLQAINRGADRIDRIVRDLLDLSQVDLTALELRHEAIQLDALVREVVERVARAAIHNRVRLCAVEPAPVIGDRARLEQVLVNLLDNAIRYSPDGGDIEVSLTRSDDRALVRVRDYGVGIPPEAQGRIFERFYRAHTDTQYDYGGMGVGLYLSREIVTRLGGEMGFTSTRGVGSTFYFSLPCRR
ncbi:MAG TPA: ATP-binding protein [Polyangia bacterium]